jgi:hypothetical protein
MNDDATVNHPTEESAPNTREPVAPVAEKRRHRENGKVARLPLEMRNLVNQSLRDGRPYREIVVLLAAEGFAGFTEHNISNWRKIGYRDWLQVQERFDAARPLSDKALALLGQLSPAGRSTLSDLNEAMLAALFHELLLDFDTPNLPAKSDEFLRLAKALAAVMGARAQRQRADLERRRYELELRNIEQVKSKPPPRVVTQETIREIERKGLRDL